MPMPPCRFARLAGPSLRPACRRFAPGWSISIAFGAMCCRRPPPGPMICAAPGFAPSPPARPMPITNRCPKTTAACCFTRTRLPRIFWPAWPADGLSREWPRRGRRQRTHRRRATDPTFYDHQVAQNAIDYLSRADPARRHLIQLGFKHPHYKLVCPDRFYQMYDPDQITWPASAHPDDFTGPQPGMAIYELAYIVNGAFTPEKAGDEGWLVRSCAVILPPAAMSITKSAVSWTRCVPRRWGRLPRW